MKGKMQHLQSLGSNEVDPKKMIALEEELLALKKQYNIEDKPKWWVRVIDQLMVYTNREKKTVNRKTYIKRALIGGGLCGLHRFYTGQKGLGILYLLFCWTGIPFAMTLVDLMIALPMIPNADGMIEL